MANWMLRKLQCILENISPPSGRSELPAQRPSATEGLSFHFHINLSSILQSNLEDKETNSDFSLN